MNLKTLLLVSFTIALASATNYELDLNDPSVIDKIQSSAVKLTVGDKLKIKAAENPTTGYIWILDYPESNDAIYKVDSSDY